MNPMNAKRKLTAAIAAIMTMSLTACAGSDPAETTAQTAPETQSETSQETESTEAAETAAETADTSHLLESSVETTDSLDTVGATYTIASLKGPTTMGMVKLMSDSEKGETFNTYNVSIHGAADEIVAGVVSGSTDIANVPANLAAVLYNKTEGNINVSAVNTLGVLYVVAVNEEINSVEDLRGKTVYSTGKGTTPEYVLNYILRQNGLEPQVDVTIEYKTEASECAAVMAESEGGIAVLPQPYVTAAMKQNEFIQIWLSLTDEWDKVSDTPLITGVTISQKAVQENNPGAYDIFLDEYAASVDYVNANTDEAAALIGGYDIIAEPVAKEALPLCNITLLRGDEMRDAVNGYWNVLFEADPAAVGGTLPDDGAFYMGNE